VDYKVMMMMNYASEEAEELAWSECHTRSAKRVLKALLANGGA
jgi:aarF domain-containing kinase